MFVSQFALCHAVYATAWLHCGVPRRISGVLKCQQPPGCTMIPTAIKLARAEQVICIPYVLSYRLGKKWLLKF